MKLRAAAAVAVIGCMVAATAVLADNGRGNQRGNGNGDNRDDVHSGQVDVIGDGDSGRGNDAVHRPRGAERRAEQQVRARHQAQVQPQCGQQPVARAECSPAPHRRVQPAVQPHCQPRPEPRVQCRPRPVSQANCSPRSEPRRVREQCQQQRERMRCGQTPARGRSSSAAPANNHGRVHDDNGHGNDVGHTDPSNPGNGRGDHGMQQH